MNPRINTLLWYVDPQGRNRGVLVVLTNQVLLGGQLVALYRDTDVIQLQTDTSAPLPQRVTFVLIAGTPGAICPRARVAAPGMVPIS